MGRVLDNLGGGRRRSLPWTEATALRVNKVQVHTLVACASGDLGHGGGGCRTAGLFPGRDMKPRPQNTCRRRNPKRPALRSLCDLFPAWKDVAASQVTA